ncbi:MAG: hypothetical protein AAFX53_08175 [Bacteroidota bacterium]
MERTSLYRTDSLRKNRTRFPDTIKKWLNSYTIKGAEAMSRIK